MEDKKEETKKAYKMTTGVRLRELDKLKTGTRTDDRGEREITPSL